MAAGGGIIIDDNLNVGLFVYGAGGGGFPALGVSVIITVTSADTIFDTVGMGSAVGVSGNILGLSIGGEIITGTARDGRNVMGLTVAVGAQAALPIEMHGEITYTGVVLIKDIPKLLENWIHKSVVSYFNKMTCDLKKQDIEKVTGVKVNGDVF